VGASRSLEGPIIKKETAGEDCKKRSSDHANSPKERISSQAEDHAIKEPQDDTPRLIKAAEGKQRNQSSETHLSLEM